MTNITQQGIEDALERAESAKFLSDEFIDVAGPLNNAARTRLEDERGIDIDSKRWVSLDDIPLGEEVLRVEENQENLDAAISTLEQLADGKIPTDKIAAAFEDAIQDLETAEGTLEDVGAKDVIKAANAPDEDNDFYGEDEEEEEDDDEK
ncbi:hypothetical protein ABK905_22385 [Acerihabitans sp. KWT182]|uniref:Uncharacterized protein n=1 Tax=Acerihabitans sp. KWT182 TaxID=3157919 RepID=A0AAU7Q8D8_9GAMM